MPANNRVEHAHSVRSTRKGDAPLLAAHAGRSAREQMITIARFVPLVLFLAAAGCGLSDSSIEWRGGRYILVWIDDPSSPHLNYDLGGGSSLGRIDEAVFSVGWD